MKTQSFAREVGLLTLLLGFGPVAAQPVPPKIAQEPPLSAAQKKHLQERARGIKEGSQLWRAGKQAEAVALLEKEITLERKVFGQFHRVTEESVEWLAQLHELREDFSAARKAWDEVLAIRTK